jgi:cobaltochelatase CobS
MKIATLVAGTHADLVADANQLKSFAGQLEKVSLYVRSGGKLYGFGVCKADFREYNRTFSAVEYGGRKMRSEDAKSEARANLSAAITEAATLAALYAGQPAPSGESVPAPVAESVPAASGSSALEVALAAAMVGVSMDSLKPIIDAYIAAEYGNLPRKLNVTIGEHEAELEGVQHSMFATVLAYTVAGRNVFMTGNAGTGKSRLAEDIAAVLKLTFYPIARVTEEWKIDGLMDAHGKHAPSIVYQWAKNGGLLFGDEVDAWDESTLTMMNDILSGERRHVFANGELVQLHADCKAIFAGNTWGTGADNLFVGRNQLDAASLNRFARMEVDYDEAVELVAANGNTELVKYAHAFRAACAECGLLHIVSMRQLTEVADMELTSVPLSFIVRTAFVQGLTEDDLTQVRSTAAYRAVASTKYASAIAA